MLYGLGYSADSVLRYLAVLQVKPALSKDVATQLNIPRVVEVQLNNQRLFRVMSEPRSNGRQEHS